MPKDEKQHKEAAAAWERDSPHFYDQHSNILSDQQLYVAGYLAAKSEQEATVLAAKREMLKEFREQIDFYGATGGGWRFALTDLTEKYSDEPTKEPT